jgi:hypothetical protein
MDRLRAMLDIADRTLSQGSVREAAVVTKSAPVTKDDSALAK